MPIDVELYEAYMQMFFPCELPPENKNLPETEHGNKTKCCTACVNNLQTMFTNTLYYLVQYLAHYVLNIITSIIIEIFLFGNKSIVATNSIMHLEIECYNALGNRL
jgi:hypothetical protein